MRDLFGEDLASAGVNCVSMTFFILFAEFVKKLSVAHKQNTEWKSLVGTVFMHLYVYIMCVYVWCIDEYI